MKVQIHMHMHVAPGAFVTYTIDGRKEPIVELYILDTGYLVLGATTTGGYMRRYYKSNHSAHRWAQSYAQTFCKFYWDESEIVPEI